MRTVVFSILLLAFQLSGLGASDAFGITTLRNVQITNGKQVDLLFDKKVTPSQIKTEFFRDIVQLSINNVSVYPAKIFSVEGESLTKVFAYQYTPKLIRTRLTVKGDATKYKDRVKVASNGRVVTVSVMPAPVAKEVITRSAASAKSVQAPAKPVSKIDQAKEDALLNRILVNQKSKVAKKAPSKPSAKKIAKRIGKRVTATKSEEKLGRDKASSKAKSSESKLTGGSETPTGMKVVGWFVFVVFLALFALILLKRYRGKWLNDKLAGASKGPMKGLLGKIAKSPLVGSGVSVEVVGNQFLGNKKSISIVKISGRTLVLGVTDSSINLLTELENDEEIEQHTDFGAGAELAGKPDFSKMVDQQLSTDPGVSQRKVRERVRQRIEGLKSI